MISSTVITVLVVDLLATSGDVSQTWTSPIYSELYSNDTTINPLGRPITKDEDSWIGSLINIGAVLGSIPAGLIADKIGRKPSLLCIAIPHFTAYVMYAFADKLYIFYIARVINGLSVGAGYALLPLYVAEITEDSNRAALSASLTVFWSFGNFIPYAIGPYLPIKIFNLILACIPLIFFTLFIFVGTESPYYLVTNGKNEKAKEVLMKLRSCDEATASQEVSKIQKIFSMNGSGRISDIFTNPGLRKALIISLILISLQQFSGINAVAYYLEPIFDASGASIPSDISSTICGMVSFLSSFLATYFIESMGKKKSLAISCLGDCLSLVMLGVYFYIHDSTTLGTDKIFWLPIAGVVSYIIFFNVGFSAVPWTVSSELFPNSVKAISASAVACFSWSFSFIITRFFNSLNDAVGRAGSFWIFGGFCLVSVAFEMIWMPETKGKNFMEIQDMLQKGNMKNSSPIKA